MTNEKLGNTVCQNSDKPIMQKVDTKKELSKIANVSYDTYYKGKRILDSDNEEIKNKSRVLTALLLVFVGKINSKILETTFF